MWSQSRLCCHQLSTSHIPFPVVVIRSPGVFYEIEGRRWAGFFNILGIVCRRAQFEIARKQDHSKFQRSFLKFCPEKICDEISSWMIEVWRKKHLVPNSNYHTSRAHMRAPPPLGEAEGDELHPRMDGGPPSTGWGRWSGPSTPARNGRVRLH